MFKISKETQSANIVRREYVASELCPRSLVQNLAYEKNLDRINNRILPLFESLEYKAPENMSDFSALKGNAIAQELVERRLSKMKFDNDYERYFAKKELTEKITEKLNSVPWILPFPQKYYDCTTFDKESGKFVFNADRVDYIYATEPNELNTLAKINALIDVFNNSFISCGNDVNISHFVDIDKSTGKMYFREKISGYDWIKFVNQQK